MSRKKLEEAKDYFKAEPYKSIINILVIAPNFHKNFKKGLKPRQLRHLLVKGYSTSDSTQRLLDNFRKNLQEEAKDRIKLDQEIGGKNPNQGFNKMLQKLVHSGWLENKDGYYTLSKRSEFEPLKIWIKDKIKESDAHDIFPHRNSTMFFSNSPLSKLTQDEKNRLMELTDELSESYESVAHHLREVGLRMAGEIWRNRIDSIKVPPEFKFYSWLYLIMIHYLATIEYADTRDCYYRGVIPSLNMDIIRRIKFRDFKPPFFLKFYTPEGILPEWQIQFYEFIETAFKRYISKIIPQFDGVRFQQEKEKHFGKFLTLYEKTLVKRAESEHFLAVVHPLNLSYFSLKDFDDTAVENIPNVIDASLTDHSSESTKKKNIVNNKNRSSFFDESGFFDELEGDIEKLGYKDKQELCYELYHLAIAFQPPKPY